MKLVNKLVLFVCFIGVVHSFDCPVGAIEGLPGSHTAPCYLYERLETQFVTAERMCKLSGGHLASIPDGFVNAFVAQGGDEAFLVMEIEDFWIGGENLGDQSVWRWVDGEKLRKYTHWDKNQPNNGTLNRCISMRLGDGKWTSQDCFDRKPYVCELGYNGNATTIFPRTPEWLTTSSTSLETEAWSTAVEYSKPTTINLPPTTAESELIPVCESGWLYITEEEGGSDQCYNVYSARGNWDEDQRFCEHQNSTLISTHIVPKFLKTFVYNTEGNPGHVDLTIGLRESIVEGVRQWNWVDQTPYDFQNWLEGYPRRVEKDTPLRCATYYTDTQTFNPDFGKWKDVPCYSEQERLVCQAEPMMIPEFLVAGRRSSESLELDPVRRKLPQRHHGA